MPDFSTVPDRRLDPAVPSLDTLLPALARLGVKVPYLDAYQRLKAARQPRVTVPPQLLNLTPDQLAELALDLAHEQAIARDAWTNVMHDLTRSAHAEFLDRLRGHADQIIADMRPRFDPAADAARAVRALGVSPDADAETMLEATEDQRRAWLDFRRLGAPTLEAVFRARVVLSRVLGIAPDLPARGPLSVGADPTWSLVVTRPGDPLATGREFDTLAAPAEPWRRWLRHAEHLALPTVAELDPEALAVAAQLPLQQLLAEARRRDTAGLAEDETDATPTAGVDLGDAYLKRYPAADTSTEERNPR